MTKRGKKRKKNILKRAGFAVVAIVLFFGFIEIICRVLFPGITGELPFWQFDNPHLNQPVMYDHDPILFWKLKPDNSGYQVNSLGFRGPEVEMEKEPGELRVICFGDSCTFGVGPTPISWEQTYPAILQTLLQEAMPNRKVIVLNFGCPGYTSFQGKWLLRKKGLAFKPDAVTTYFGINDEFMANGFTDADQRPMVDAPTSIGPFKKLLSHLSMYEVMVRAIYGARLSIKTSKDGAQRVPKEDYHKNLNQIETLGQKESFATYFMVPPYLEQDQSLNRLFGLDHEPQIDIFTPIQKSMETGVAAIFGPPDNVHPTVEGHRIIAQAIFERLMKDKPWEK